MKAFLKENATLSLGLGLPLLLVFLLWASATWIERTGTPPAFDVIFASDYYDYSSGVRFVVEGGKFKAQFIGKGYSSHPHLFRYNAKEGVAKEITYTIPAGLTDTSGTNSDKGTTPLSIPELEGLKIDTAATSPDGFTFDTSYHSRPFMSDLFFSGGSRSYTSVMLTKGSYRKYISVPDTYSYSNKFIGWVIP